MLRSLHCFYINKNSDNNLVHIGHLPHTNDNVNCGITDVLEDAMHAVTKLFENRYPMSIAQQFLEMSGGGKFPQKSMSKLRETVLMRKYKSSSAESVAETLMRVLSEDDTTSFVFHTGSYNKAQQLVRVRRKCKSKG